jgi:hypothetical protein
MSLKDQITKAILMLLSKEFLCTVLAQVCATLVYIRVPAVANNPDNFWIYCTAIFGINVGYGGLRTYQKKNGNSNAGTK